MYDLVIFGLEGLLGGVAVTVIAKTLTKKPKDKVNKQFVGKKLTEFTKHRLTGDRANAQKALAEVIANYPAGGFDFSLDEFWEGKASAEEVIDAYQWACTLLI